MSKICGSQTAAAADVHQYRSYQSSKVLGELYICRSCKYIQGKFISSLSFEIIRIQRTACARSLSNSSKTFTCRFRKYLSVVHNVVHSRENLGSKMKAFKIHFEIYINLLHYHICCVNGNRRYIKHIFHTFDSYTCICL